ncbi:uncharacterized protein LOC116198689 [Punica granatum]|uniref:Uncharacterized protein LOC116198689 n=2 Tax=Punica granatum TaxID=22663 RepID=A0A6P8CMP4_PUNGR|nr:uncharacterized protein LOC116198689 [Punica granatum]
METDVVLSRFFPILSSFALSLFLALFQYFVCIEIFIFLLRILFISNVLTFIWLKAQTILAHTPDLFSSMAAATGSMFSSAKTFSSNHVVRGRNEISSGSSAIGSSFTGTIVGRNSVKKAKTVKIVQKVRAAATVISTNPVEETKEYALPSWAKFELGLAPVYWKTMNGLPPTSGQKLKLFYNPAATKLTPNEEFGVGFNGGFNQPIMCGGEPRVMLRKDRGKADSPIYTIQICVPKHALSLIFSFTNGINWDGPYRLQFQVPRAWQNKPIEFFNEGLAEELSRDGACDRAIFPDTSIMITRCAMIGNLNVEGGDRCELNLVPGCMDTSSPFYDPLANVDDGSCPPYSDSESED